MLNSVCCSVVVAFALVVKLWTWSSEPHCEFAASIRFQRVKNMRSIASRLRRPCSVSTTEHLFARVWHVNWSIVLTLCYRSKGFKRIQKDSSIAMFVSFSFVHKNLLKVNMLVVWLHWHRVTASCQAYWPSCQRIHQPSGRKWRRQTGCVWTQVIEDTVEL